MEKKGAEGAAEQETKKLEMGLAEKYDLTNQKKKLKKKKKQNCLWVPRFGCMRLEDDVPTAEAGFNGKDQPPTHLIVTVNGIIGRFNECFDVIKHVTVCSVVCICSTLFITISADCCSFSCLSLEIHKVFVYFVIVLVFYFTCVQCTKLEICCEAICEGIP